MLDPRALIFDMDGLMIDSEPLWWKVERALADEHGRSWTDSMAEQCVGTGLPNTIRTMRDQLQLDIEVDAGVRWLVATFIERIDELELKPGLSELVDAAEAAGLPSAVATSSTTELLDAVLTRFGLAPRFTATVSGDDVERAKPAPDIFLLAAQRLGVGAAHCVVLEDSTAGVNAANAAAIPVIAVPEFNRDSFGALTPHVVDDLHQARGLLRL